MVGAGPGPPPHLEGLGAVVGWRLWGGLVIGWGKPDRDTRLSILKARAEEVSDFQEWAARCRREDDIRSRPYDIDGAFRADEVIAHPSFGLGVVKTTIPPNKMEVLFEGGRKLLRCRL